MEYKKKYSIFFALLFPVLGMVAALYFHKDKYAKYLFWLGCVYLGFVHIFNPINESGADGVRYAQRLTEYAGIEINSHNLKDMFYSNGDNNDIYQQTVTLLVSRFTTNAHILFCVFAAIMGFFYTGNIWMVLDRFNGDKNKWFIWLLIIMYIMLVPIYQINGVRMWTALHVFVFGALSYYLRSSKSSLLWVFVTPFIHFSYLPFVLFFLIFLFLPKKSHTIYFVFFFVSVFVDNLQDYIPLKDLLLQYSPQFLHTKIDEYLIEGYSEYEADMLGGLSFYVKLVPMSLKIFIYVFIGFVWLNFKKLINSDEQKVMLFIFLFIGGIVQMLSSLPQMVRFDRLVHMFFFVFILLTYSNYNKLETKVYNFGKYISFLLLLPLFFTFRLGTEYYGFSMFIGNFLSAMFIEDRYPLVNLKDLLK